MKRPAWLALAATVLWLACSSWATAAIPQAPVSRAPAHVSYSVWNVDGASVRLDVMLPRAAAGGLVAPGAHLQDTAAVAAAVAASVGVDSAGGPCEAIDQGEGAGRIYVMAPTPTLYRFEIIFACPQPDGLVLRDRLLFDRFPDQLNYAQVRIAGGAPAIQIFDRRHPSLALSTGKTTPQASLLRFVLQGAAHVVGQADRLLVVFGLLLVARRWRDLGVVAAALGAGYLAALALALGGFGLADRSWQGVATALAVLLLGASALRLRPPGPAPPRGLRITAAAFAVLIVAAVVAIAALKSPSAAIAAVALALFAGAQIWLAGSWPRLGWIAFAPAALFALVDGLGPAEDLAMLQTPAAQAAPRLLAYDLGATAAATALVAAGMVVIWLLARKLSPTRRTAAIDLAGALLVGFGLFWFASRIYG